MDSPDFSEEELGWPEKELSECEFIDKFAYDLTKKNGSFSLSDAIAVYKGSPYEKKTPNENGRLSWGVEVVILPENNEFRYFSRNAFFEHAEFLVKLSDYEVKNGIFIPGNCLIPFFMDNFPPNLFETGLDHQFDRIHVTVPFAELNSFYSLYDCDDGAFSQIATSNTNAPKMYHPAEGTVYGYDFSSFMAKNKFALGDYIKIKIKHYDYLKCEIEYCPASTVAPDSPQAIKWRRKFEAGLAKAVDYQKRYGGELVNKDLVAAAFFYGGKSLLKNPSGSWWETIGDSDKFSFQCFDSKLLLWEKGGLRRYMRNEQFLNNPQEPFDFETITFATLTARMGFRMYEINTMEHMLNIMSAGGTLREARKQCYMERYDNCSAALRQRFHKEIGRLWRRAKRFLNSDSCSDEVMEYRQALLELRSRELAFINKLDSLEIPAEEMYCCEFAVLEKLFDDTESYMGDLMFGINQKTLRKTKKAIGKIGTQLKRTVKQLEEKFRMN